MAVSTTCKLIIIGLSLLITAFPVECQPSIPSSWLETLQELLNILQKLGIQINSTTAPPTPSTTGYSTTKISSPTVAGTNTQTSSLTKTSTRSTSVSIPVSSSTKSVSNRFPLESRAPTKPVSITPPQHSSKPVFISSFTTNTLRSTPKPLSTSHPLSPSKASSTMTRTSLSTTKPISTSYFFSTIKSTNTLVSTNKLVTSITSGVNVISSTREPAFSSTYANKATSLSTLKSTVSSNILTSPQSSVVTTRPPTKFSPTINAITQTSSTVTSNSGSSNTSVTSPNPTKVSPNGSGLPTLHIILLSLSWILMTIC